MSIVEGSVSVPTSVKIFILEDGFLDTKLVC